MRYASGLRIPDPFILLDDGKRKLVAVSSLEYRRVKASFRGETILADPYLRGARSMGEAAARLLKERRIRRVRMGRRALAIHVEALRKRSIAVELSTTGLYPERAVKSAAEAARIRAVRRATVAAMRRCLAIIRDGTVNRCGDIINKDRKVTVAFLKREVRRTLLEHGCEAESIIISHGRQTGLPHHEGNGALKAGEPIILDLYPRSSETGYWFDMTRTVCKGKAPAWLRRQYAAVKEAQDAALARVKAGAKPSAIHRAAEEAFRRRGFTTTETEGFIHSTGHGVGLEIHEEPGIGPRNDRPLRAGNIITIEPGLYYKRGGVRLENTVRVTTTGYEDLTRMRRTLRP